MKAQPKKINPRQIRKHKTRARTRTRQRAQTAAVSSAQIIPFPNQQKPFLLVDLDDLVGFHGVKLLARQIQSWMKANKKEHTFKVLAQRSQLTPKTVSRIMNRETMAPRMLTCIMLFKAIGFKAARFEYE
jgi:hypothetical protein